MNHLRNLAAKNLHQVEVIQPRLASRFETMHQNNWPNIKHIPSMERDDMGEVSRSSTGPVFYVRDASPARTISRHVYSSAEREPFGHVVSAEPATSGVVQNRGRNDRSLQPVAEAKSPIPFPERKVMDISENAAAGKAEASQFAHSSIGTPMDVSSIIPASSRQSKSRQKGIVPGITQDAGDKARSEIKLSAEVDFAKKGDDTGYGIIPKPGIKEEESEKSKSEQKPSKVEIAPLQSAEKVMHFSLNQEKRILAEPTLKQRDIEKPKSEQKLSWKETVPLRSNQDKEKMKDPKKDIQHKDRERSASFELERPIISPRMTVARPTVKNYLESKKREIEEKMTRLETKPDVLVTIGRIEVRAMPLATISQRKQEKPPVTSLEDYLKNKPGGL
jgi:hypothetical protein